MHCVVFVDVYGKRNWAAADLTILNVILLGRRVIDKHADPLAAVWASKPLFALLHDSRQSITEIGELEWKSQLGVFDQCDDRLQVITIFAGYA